LFQDLLRYLFVPLLRITVLIEQNGKVHVELVF